MKVDLVNYTEEFLELSWLWLNDEEIKKLTSTPNFSKQDQIKWFESISKKKDYKIWGVIANEIKIGVCGLKKITAEDAEYWGYIGNKEFWGKGIGEKIINELICFAKNKKLKSLWLTVTADNIRATRLYTKAGFVNELDNFDGLIKMRLLL